MDHNEATCDKVLRHLPELISVAPHHLLVAFLESVILSGSLPIANPSAADASRMDIQRLLSAQHPCLQMAWPAAIHNVIVTLLQQASCLDQPDHDNHDSSADFAISEPRKTTRTLHPSASAVKPGQGQKVSKKRRLSEPCLPASSYGLAADAHPHTSQKKKLKVIGGSKGGPMPVLLEVQAGNRPSGTCSTPDLTIPDPEQLSDWIRRLAACIAAAGQDPSSSQEPASEAGNFPSVLSSSVHDTVQLRALHRLGSLFAIVKHVAHCVQPPEAGLALASILLQTSQLLMSRLHAICLRNQASGRSAIPQDWQHDPASKEDAQQTGCHLLLKDTAALCLSALAVLLLSSQSAAAGIAGLHTTLSSLFVDWMETATLLDHRWSSAVQDRAENDGCSSSSNICKGIAGIAEGALGNWLQTSNDQHIVKQRTAAIDMLIEADIKMLEQQVNSLANPACFRGSNLLCQNQDVIATRTQKVAGCIVGSAALEFVCVKMAAPCSLASCKPS